MKSTKFFSTAGIIMIIFGIACSACNLPIKRHIVTSEGEIVEVPILHGEKWICKDIDGVISYYEGNAELAPEAYIINRADLDLTVEYDSLDEHLLINYLVNMEVDEGYLNVEGNAYEHWNHAKWSERGKFDDYPTIGTDERSASGVFDVTTNMQGTYPSTIPQEYVIKHHFFVLFLPEKSNKAYFCDIGAVPVPDGWDKLTVENFRDFCNSYYYECAISKP